MRINEFLVKDKMSYGSNYQPKLEIVIMIKKKHWLCRWKRIAVSKVC